MGREWDSIELVLADVRVLTERATQIAGREEDGSRTADATKDKLLASMMKVRANPRLGLQLTRPVFRSLGSIYAAVPLTEIAAPQHSEGQLDTKIDERCLGAHKVLQMDPSLANVLPDIQEQLSPSLMFHPQFVVTGL
jgi:hypothetical protein